MEKLKICLMADFSATWSASDRHVFPYNSETETRIEASRAPEDRARGSCVISDSNRYPTPGSIRLRCHSLLTSHTHQCSSCTQPIWYPMQGSQTGFQSKVRLTNFYTANAVKG